MTLADQFKLLLRLYTEPGAAMSGILDRGSLLFASAAVLAVSFAGPGRGLGLFMPLLLLAAVYVPGTLLIAQWTGGLRGAFRRDYSPLLTCAAMAYSAVNLPLAIAGRLLPAAALTAVSALLYLYFAVLMFFAIRTVLGVSDGVAAASVGLSWIPLVAAAIFWAPLQYVLGWLASPFFLFYAYYYLGGELTNLGSGFRQRQSFHRMLETATVNPHDGGARYQLGLIYQERRQYAEAIQRFTEAVAIDPNDTDAHFQLGRIALEQGRLGEALSRFQTVIDQDEKHHSHEILRELGRLYLSVRQYEDARRELAAYVDRRPYDPEGLFYYGEALEHLGLAPEARDAYARAVDAAAAAPHYLRRSMARWSRQAQKQSRNL
jgi:tetratricopeptide (TPR) repeat protein